MGFYFLRSGILWDIDGGKPHLATGNWSQTPSPFGEGAGITPMEFRIELFIISSNYHHLIIMMSGMPLECAGISCA